MWTLEIAEPHQILDSLSEDELNELVKLLHDNQKFMAIRVLFERKRWHLNSIMDAVQVLAEKVTANENSRHP